MPEKAPSLVPVYINISKDIRQELEAMKSKSGLAYRVMLQRMIEEVAADQALLARVQAYYLRNKNIPALTVGRWVLQVKLEEEVRDLLVKLAFDICGTGNVSDVSKTLIRYYADHGDVSRLPVQSKRPKPNRQNVITMPKPKPKAQRDSTQEWVMTSCTCDKETIELLDRLVPAIEMRRMELVRHLIEVYAGDEKLLDELRRAPELWMNPTKPVGARFILTEDTELLLMYISSQIMGGVNKSAAIRALVKREAERLGLRNQKRNAVKSLR